MIHSSLNFDLFFDFVSFSSIFKSWLEWIRECFCSHEASFDSYQPIDFLHKAFRTFFKHRRHEYAFWSFFAEKFHSSILINLFCKNLMNCAIEFWSFQFQSMGFFARHQVDSPIKVFRGKSWMVRYYYLLIVLLGSVNNLAHEMKPLWAWKKLSHILMKILEDLDIEKVSILLWKVVGFGINWSLLPFLSINYQFAGFVMVIELYCFHWFANCLYVWHFLSTFYCSFMTNKEEIWDNKGKSDEKILEKNSICHIFIWASE